MGFQGVGLGSMGWGYGPQFIDKAGARPEADQQIFLLLLPKILVSASRQQRARLEERVPCPEVDHCVVL